MALTRVEVLLKMMNDVTKRRPKTAAIKFKIDVLTEHIQNPPEFLTESDIKILQEELDKLKKDFVYPSPESLKFYFAMLDAFVKETNYEHKERYREYLTDIIKETERYGSEDIATIKRTLAEHEPK